MSHLSRSFTHYDSAGNAILIFLEQQILQSHAARIAETYTVDCDEWKSAAANLRQPFWDWATKSVPPDVVISDETVRIPLPPHGIESDVINPFIRYRFRDGETSQFKDPVTDWLYTVRHPSSQGKEATSDVKRLKMYVSPASQETTAEMAFPLFPFPVCSTQDARIYS
jgi:tyrosinase